MKTEITIEAVKDKDCFLVKSCEGCIFSKENACSLPIFIENSGIVKCEKGYIYKIKESKK